LNFNANTSEAVEKRAWNYSDVINTVIPDPDPVSPAYINGWRSRIKCGMTPYLDSFGHFYYIFISNSF